MENKVVCDYCGTIYDGSREKCPLCGSTTRAEGAPAAPPRKGNLGDGAAGKEGLGLDDIDEPHGHSDDEGGARTFFQHVTGDAGQRERGIADEDDGPVE